MDFIKQHKEEIGGILHGFDRLIFKGSLWGFFPPKAIYYYLQQRGIRLLDYKRYMDSQNRKFSQHLETIAQQSKVKIHYLNNSKESKDEIAKSYLAQTPNKKGLIAILSVQETSNSFSLIGNKAKKELEVIRQLRRHLHYYLYYMDEEFGWMYIRIQSWYPFKIIAYVNGREHLKQSLTKEGIAYESFNNSLTWIEDLPRAQQLCDELVQKNWGRFFNAFAKRINPFLTEIERILGKGYRWYTEQPEYASDVMFNNREFVKSLLPHLLQRATYFRGGEDIYSFFGRKLTGNSTKQVTGSHKKFEQGFRVKHYLGKNSIKMYDKDSIIRVETTLNNARAFKISKLKTNDKGQQYLAWVPMGKAVSNLYRVAQIARSANMKYLNALADIKLPKGMDKHIEKISNRVSEKKNSRERFFAGLNLLSKKTSLILEAINDARFCIASFSNRDLRLLLVQKGVFVFDEKVHNAKKKLSAKVTRLLAKLKAHKIIKKITGANKYSLTKLGAIVCNEILDFKKIQLLKI